ncbi:hypothetical protein RHS01_03523 [Rhizoctonia solani]|uniref:Peptidase M14 domain-containing protein n=1 Tax=Rhizoctonia solani TaxID=456999 RepID=A0A8H7IJJ1_9AGAM|nr:hypothetical protein RHS01_03523 [Rhizoctonia solani]
MASPLSGTPISRSSAGSPNATTFTILNSKLRLARKLHEFRTAALWHLHNFESPSSGGSRHLLISEPAESQHRRMALTPSHVDVHMDTTADLPLSLANRRYTTLPHSFIFTQDNEFHRAYHTYEEINQFVVALASQYPKLVEVVWLGASSEERDVFAIRIGKRSRAGGKKGKKHKSKDERKSNKSTIWDTHPLVEMAHHYAGNLISRLMEVGELILRGRATTMRDLYSNPRFDAITLSRPIKDRMVIKARSTPGRISPLFPFPIPTAMRTPGTGDTSGTRQTTSLEARGPMFLVPGAYPFQAPEVTAIANYIRRTPKIRGFLDYAVMDNSVLMYPYSYSCEHVAPHAENLIEAALGATKALRETHGIPYTSGASCELLYPAPGNIIDWTYGDAGIKYSYSLMLRDTGTYGFLLPPRYIQPVGEETASAVKSLVKFIEDDGM